MVTAVCQYRVLLILIIDSQSCLSTADIETVIIVDDKVEFPGTYSGEQQWDTKVPEHGQATIELNKFQKASNDTDFVLWVNTWNHLLGDQNNNTKAEIVYCNAQPCGGTETLDSIDYVLRKGSRAQVDARFRGIITSITIVMTPETQAKLGKRVF